MYFPGENTFYLDIAIERFRIQTNINKYKTCAEELNDKNSDAKVERGRVQDICRSCPG
jgi:hypothetical protein